jgi:tryptophanase
MDITALERLLKQKGGENIPLVMMTVTNNSCAGQPVSMGCIRRVSDLCRSYKIPFFIDACRFAENAWFIKMREPGCKGRSVKDLAQEMFSYADGCTMSGKKDGLVNIGGFLAMNNDELARKARNILIVTEGFPTYGGLAGRDLEAFAQGLEEVVDEDYLRYRIRSTSYVLEKLDAIGVPVFKPAGGHAVYLDVSAFLPHVPPPQFPGQALACALYLEGGIRSCEIGSVMFGRTDPTTGGFQAAMLELLRLAIPRRVYTQSHMDYVVECIGEVFSRRESIRGVRIVQEPKILRHFTAVFDPL